MQKLLHDFHDMERRFFSLISLNCLDYQTITAFETGVLATGLNPAFVTKIDEKFLHDLAHCRSCFAQNNLPWALIVSEHTPIFSEQDNPLPQDYELTDTGVGMALDLVANSLNTPDNQLEFKEMNKDLHTWSIPLIHRFQSTPEITHVYTLRHDEALKKSCDIHHFSGFFAKEAVVSITLTVKENLARIDDLATLPRFQKRGFASALLAYTLQKALDLKVQTCFLEASTAGLNLYKRIGFQPLFTNHYYELSAS
jgi:GNAT superfamily N-acetyltransferase